MENVKVHNTYKLRNSERKQAIDINEKKYKMFLLVKWLYLKQF